MSANAKDIFLMSEKQIIDTHVINEAQWLPRACIIYNRCDARAL